MRSRPAKALPETSRTAPSATVRYTDGGMPVSPPPTSAASWAGDTRTRSSRPSSSDASSAPARGTDAFEAAPGGLPDSSIPAGSAPAASMCSSNGMVSRPCDMSRDGRVRSGSAGRTASSVMESGAFDSPANRRPAASETADDGRSRRTGPASRWALATAPFWAGVRNMRSVSSSTVRYCTSGPDGGTTSAPDRGTRLAPPASSMAAPERSIASAGMCSSNMNESTPVPMSRAGIVSGRIAGGTESSTTDSVPLPPPPPAPPAAGIPANALPDRSAMPLPASTEIRSGPADAFAARSEAACACENSSARRVPSSSPSPSPPETAASAGDCAPFPSLSATDTACGASVPAATNSSNASVRSPVPRLRIGVPARPGGALSATAKRAAPADRPAGLPDRSNAAPAAASSRRVALEATAASRRAFWEGASATTTVSLAAIIEAAPARGMRPAPPLPPPAATANAPASSPPGGPATCSSYATASRPAPRSRTVRFKSSAGGALSSATAMRAPDTAADGSRSLANPAGRYSCAAGPAATAPAFWAAVSLTITVALSPKGSCTGASAPSRPTAVPALRISAPVRFVADRSTGWSNSISKTPVLRSSRTGE